MYFHNYGNCVCKQEVNKTVMHTCIFTLLRISCCSFRNMNHVNIKAKNLQKHIFQLKFICAEKGQKTRCDNLNHSVTSWCIFLLPYKIDRTKEQVRFRPEKGFLLKLNSSINMSGQMNLSWDFIYYACFKNCTVVIMVLPHYETN